MMTYKEFKKSKNLLFYSKKVIYNYNNINYYLFSKTTNLKHNEENLYNCYEYIKENKSELSTN